MPITLEHLLGPRKGKVTVIHHSTLVKEAPAVMIKSDFSLLPIIDDRENLIGAVSERSIARTHFSMDGANLLHLQVDACLDRPATLHLADRLSSALGILATKYAVIVLENQKPIGIITDYDTNLFFQRFSEDFYRIGVIEKKLRSHFEAAFQTPAKQLSAINTVRAHHNMRQIRGRRKWIDLADLLSVMFSDSFWHRFEPFFLDRQVAYDDIDQVRQFRNRLAHFDEPLTNTEGNLLRKTQRWVEEMPEANVGDD